MIFNFGLGNKEMGMIFNLGLGKTLIKFLHMTEEAQPSRAAVNKKIHVTLMTRAAKN